MTAIVKRRGMIRPISQLPVSPGGAALMEVEIGGAFYQANASGGSTWNQTLVQLPLSTSFADDKGHTVTTTGTVSITGGVAVFTAGGGKIGVANDATTGNDLQSGWVWCLEGWFKTTSVLQYATIAEHDAGAFAAGSWALLLNNVAASGKVSFWAFGKGSPIVESPSAVNDNVRHHVAVSRNGTDTRLYIDGALVAVDTAVGPASVSQPASEIRFGNSTYASRQFIGSLDNWRVVDGAVLYTAKSFTVPTPPFPVS